MAIRVGDNILPNIKGNLDARYGPYDSIQEALEKVFDPDSENRDRGITVGIRFGDTIKEYWFEGGIEDSNFVEKKPSDYIKITEKGTANGVAPLNAQRLISSEFLPSYVDDVIEVYASFDKSSSGVLENIQLYLDEQKTQSVTGERGKIYIDLLTNYQFRWSGTIFTPISIPDSSIVDLGQFENETAADNIMLADNTGVIFNSQCLIITYKIGEQRAIIINQYNTERSVQYKYFNGRKYFRYINHNNTTVTEVQEWELDDTVNLLYDESTHTLSHSNRYGDTTIATLPLVTSTTDGLMSKEDKTSLTNNTEKITSIWEGDLPFNNTLSLNGTWTIYDQNDSFVEQRSLPISGNNEVEFGYKAEYSGAWKWTLANGNKPAIETKGDWKTELPSSGVWSKTHTFNRVTANITYTQTIYAPKRGLVVSGSNVVPASTIGSKDSRSISTSITFKHRLYYGAVTSSTPSADIIKALTSKLDDRKTSNIDGQNRVNTVIENVSTGKLERYCFAYPKKLGILDIIKQGSQDISGAFFDPVVVNITNTAGLSIDLYVYVSARLGAFTNQKLTFIWR